MPILAIQTMRWNSPIAMAVRLRTAARAADELGVSCRELARRFADQVDADLASDADPLGLPIGLVWLVMRPANLFRSIHGPSRPS